MKKIYFLAFVLFSSLFATSQERRMDISSYTTKTGETISDTVWRVSQIVKKEELEGDDVIIKLDTIWIVEKKSKPSKKENNPVTPAALKGNVAIGLLFNNDAENATLGFSGMRLGYFISNNLMLGGGLSGTFDLEAGDLTNLNVSVFQRNYFGKSKNSKTYFETLINSELYEGIFEAGIGIGKSIFVGSNFSADLGLMYINDFETAGKIVFGVTLQGIINRSK
jgi:hypothetical protein